jgi:hypothetical protein
VNGLGKVVDGTELHRFNRRFVGGIGRDHDHASSRLPPEDLGQDAQSRLGPEPQIEEDRIESGPVKDVGRAGRSSGLLDPRVIGLQAQPERLPDGRVIVNDECRERKVVSHARTNGVVSP